MESMMKSFLCKQARMLCLFLLCFQFYTVYAAGEEHPSERIIQEFNITLITAMKDAKELGFSGRYEMFSKAVPKAFDIKTIMNIAVGREWREYSDENKEKLIELYKEFTAATYASRFKKFNEHSFDIHPAEEKGKRRASVKSTMLKAEGEPIDFIYEMRRSGEDWRIIDIRVKGVSRLANTKAQYASILKDEGYDGLVRSIESTIAEIKSENS
jgi:phospholipid transport system substrate-binding protein